MKIKIIKILLIIMFTMFGTNVLGNYDKLAYEFTFDGIDGNKIKLLQYKNKVIVVVNVASQCGFTKQYEDMQDVWIKYQDKGILMLGVPSNDFNQETGTNEEIKKFCESKFGITFPMTDKVTVKGDNAHPFYKWAKNNHGNKAIPKWNFHKIIIGRDGKVIDTFSSITKPTSKKFIKVIENALK